MSTTGKVKTLFSDKEKTEALFPRTKTSAVSDDNGVGLNVLLENMVHVGDPVEAAVAPVNADTLGGRLADEFATQNYVSTKIAEAQMGGGSGSVDLSGYATKDEVADAVTDAIGELDTIIAVDENTDGNIEFRTFLPEEDYVQIDKTLTTEGAAADAKAVGDRLVDYIVEQGTSGSWIYRKWNSGIAECWGTHKNIAVQGHTTYGSIIYAGYGSVYLPSIFTEVTNVNQSCFVTTGYDWCGKVMVSGVSSLTLYPMSGSAISTGSKFTAYIHVHGRWK